MAYRPHGRARVDPRNPQAWAICDACGFNFNLVDLSWQYAWRGASLVNTRLLKCERCLDIPQEQLRTLILPPDPVPVMNARVEPYIIDESPSTRVATTGQIRVATNYPRNSIRVTSGVS